MILTIGHSNRTLEDFLALLTAHGVQVVIDVRKLPGSRLYPHFNAEELAASLAGERIDYVHAPGLGGRRKPNADSPNGAWRNASFRAFADYMQTSDFAAEVGKLIELSQHRQPVIMCSEAVPWRCHRSLISDALVSKGEAVEHIMSAKKRDIHHLKPWARVRDGKVTYPPPDDQPRLF